MASREGRALNIPLMRYWVASADSSWVSYLTSVDVAHMAVSEMLRALGYRRIGKWRVLRSKGLGASVGGQSTSERT